MSKHNRQHGGGNPEPGQVITVIDEAAIIPPDVVERWIHYPPDFAQLRYLPDEPISYTRKIPTMKSILKIGASIAALIALAQIAFWGTVLYLAYRLVTHLIGG